MGFGATDAAALAAELAMANGVANPAAPDAAVTVAALAALAELADASAAGNDADAAANLAPESTPLASTAVSPGPKPIAPKDAEAEDAADAAVDDAADAAVNAAGGAPVSRGARVLGDRSFKPIPAAANTAAPRTAHNTRWLLAGIGATFPAATADFEPKPKPVPEPDADFLGDLIKVLSAPTAPTVPTDAAEPKCGLAERTSAGADALGAAPPPRGANTVSSVEASASDLLCESDVGTTPICRKRRRARSA